MQWTTPRSGCCETFAGSSSDRCWRRSPPSRYDPRPWQTLLKPVVGAATALAGVLLIQADLLIGPASSRSESLFLSYAVIFGFSQQLFTRFVDKRAGALIDTDGEESEDGSKK